MMLTFAVLAALQADPDPACLFDGSCAARAPAAVAAASAPGPRGPLTGLKKGAAEGALLGFLGTEYPAIELLDRGFDREVSRGGEAGPYTVGGFVLGALLYIPALAVGAVAGLVGALVGAGAEAARPGSTQKWNAESLFGI